MKKDTFLPAIRIDAETKQEYLDALEYYGISNAQFVRAVIACLLDKYQKGQPLPLALPGRSIKAGKFVLNPPLDKRG